MISRMFCCLRLEENGLIVRHGRLQKEDNGCQRE